MFEPLKVTRLTEIAIYMKHPRFQSPCPLDSFELALIVQQGQLQFIQKKIRTTAHLNEIQHIMRFKGIEAMTTCLSCGRMNSGGLHGTS